MTITVHLNDLPPDVSFGSAVAIDDRDIGP